MPSSLSSNVSKANLSNPDIQELVITMTLELQRGGRARLNYGTDVSDEHAANTTKQLIPLLLENGGHVFLAYQGDACVGIMICLNSISSYTLRLVLNVHDMYVREENRQQGHAKALLEAARNWAKLQGYVRLSLEVQAKNTRAVKLYREFGFKGVPENRIMEDLAKTETKLYLELGLAS
ncbi:GNAT family N-acetyltransferase [bacterium]|nr:GNAT family N-acetyltransferase [bacterium]